MDLNFSQLTSAFDNFFGSKNVEVFSNGISGASNQTSSPFGGGGYKFIGFQFVATGLDAADGVIKIQDSIDGSNWNDIASASITVAAGTSSNMIRYTAFTGQVLRAVWTKNSNSAGTLHAVAQLKK